MYIKIVIIYLPKDSSISSHANFRSIFITIEYEQINS